MNIALVIDPSSNNNFKPKDMPLSIEVILAKSDKTYDVSPVYQRDFVWKRRRQQKLIDSIVAGRSINAFHICRKDNTAHSSEYYVVDGKQRLSTIRNFFNGKYVDGKKFAVKIRMTNGEERYVTFEDAKRLSEKDSNCAVLVQNFLEYTLRFNVYESLDIPSQKELFECINESEHLSANEQIFCRNYIAKSFYKSIYFKYFNCLFPFLSQEMKNDNRFKGARMVAEFLYLSYGKDFEDKFLCRDTKTLDMNKTIDFVNQKLEHNGLDGTSLPDPIVLEKILGKEKLQEVKEVLKSFEYILSDKRPVLAGAIKTSRDKMWVFDCINWLMSKFQKDILNFSYVSENYEKFLTMFKDYQTWRDSNDAIKEQTVMGRKMEKRLSIIEAMFNDQVRKFDTGEKNKSAPKSTLSARLNAPQNDSITGRLLQDVDIDHVPPKSLSSENKFVAIDSHGNRKKSNFDAKFAQKTLDYQKEHESQEV